MPPRGRPEAGRSGAMVLRALRAALAKGWKPGLTVLTGDDVFHLDRAQDALLAHLVPEDSPDFALQVFGEGKVQVADLVAAARSMPMFARRRLVFVRDASVLEGEEAPLSAYAARPPEYSFLLVRAPKLDLRRTLHKTLAGAGMLLEFRPSESDAELHEEVLALARERRLTLDRSVASFLVEVCARDLCRVVSELEKIAAWVGPEGEGRPLTLQDAREVAAGGGLLTGWEVANALLDRDAAAAVAAVRRLVDAGEEPIRILGGLAYRARALLQAKAMSESGVPRGQITAALRAWPYEEALHRSLGRYTLTELVAFPARLLEADRALKSRSLDPRALLETLVVSLTRPKAQARQEAS